MAKYNTKIVKTICSSIETGLSQKDSAVLSGINEDTFYTWKNEKPEFSESVERAIIKYKQKLITQVNSYSIKDGRLALEVLSRKWPHEFGKIQTLEAPKEDPKQKPPTEETLQKWIRLSETMEKGRLSSENHYKRKYQELLTSITEKYPQFKISNTSDYVNNGVNNL